MSVYLHLFHGRKTPDENLDDWGSDGPVIGPLRYVHITYMATVRLGIQRKLVEKFFPAEHQKMVEFVAKTPSGFTSCYTDPEAIEDIFLPFAEDLIEHDGVYYGDFSIGGSELQAVDFNAGAVLG
jgi:hypothetical protein